MQRNKQNGNTTTLSAHCPYLIKLIKSILPEDTKLFSVPESPLFLDGKTGGMNNVYNNFKHTSQLKHLFHDLTNQWHYLSVWPRNLYKINSRELFFSLCRRYTWNCGFLLTRKHGLREKLLPVSRCFSTCCSYGNTPWNMKCWAGWPAATTETDCNNSWGIFNWRQDLIFLQYMWFLPRSLWLFNYS